MFVGDFLMIRCVNFTSCKKVYILFGLDVFVLLFKFIVIEVVFKLLLVEVLVCVFCLLFEFFLVGVIMLRSSVV